jgi:hypothetical protein
MEKKLIAKLYIEACKKSCNKPAHNIFMIDCLFYFDVWVLFKTDKSVNKNIASSAGGLFAASGGVGVMLKRFFK